MAIQTRVGGLVLLIAVLPTGCLSPESHQVQISPDVQDVPRGFDFPNPTIASPAPRNAAEYSRIREHIWCVWAGMNQPVDCRQNPIWSTWPDALQVFDPNEKIVLRPSGGLSGLATPRQFTGLGMAVLDYEVSDFRRDPNLVVCQKAPFASVLFNPNAAVHIRDDELYKTSRLKRGSTVKPFDPGAIAVKAVWWPVHAKMEYSAVPVWNGQARYPVNQGLPNQNQCGNGPLTWLDVVAVRADGARVEKGARTNVEFTDPEAANGHRQFNDVPIIPLSDFYYVPLSRIALPAAQLDRLNDLIRKYWPEHEAVDPNEDGLVLVGMHVATREIENWLWATFWWHNAADEGEFGADKSDCLKDRWRNFRMDCTVDASKTVFNPYLEGMLASGSTSNCMACHQRASVPLGIRNSIRDFVGTGLIPAGDDYFRDKLSTSFLWSIPDLAK